MSINNNLNDNKSSFISPLEQKDVDDLTKNFIREALYQKLKNNSLPKEIQQKLCPSNFKLDDKNLFILFKLEYTIIDDFLIRTKLNYTHSIFNNEIKSIIKPLIPCDDTELMSLLGLNLSELNSLRFQAFNSSNFSEQIKSTYLYQILNAHTKIMKIDTESQTNNAPILDNSLYSPDVRIGLSIPQDLEIRMKNIEEKYNSKIREGNDILLIENRFKKYKDEMDKMYEEQLKVEMERFKNLELSQMRIEENKKYLIKLEKLREQYQEEYNKKYEELKMLKNELNERALKLQKEYEERNMNLKNKYEEKEKNLDFKENYLEKKYKNDMDISLQRIKFNEELNSLRESILNNEKDNIRKNINKNIYQEINPLINRDIEQMRKEIEEIKNNLINNQPLKNNFIKQDEDKKKYNINNKSKPSKESVLNSLNLLTKNINNNNLNKSKSSHSPNGSGAYNNKAQSKNERFKRLEELDEEQYKLNNQMREDFQKILHGDNDILLIENDEFESMKNKKNYEINMNKYKHNDFFSEKKNYIMEEEKLNNYINNTNKNINLNKNYENNNINNNKESTTDYIKINNNINIETNKENNLDNNNIKLKNYENDNKYNFDLNNNKEIGLFNNNIINNNNQSNNNYINSNNNYINSTNNIVNKNTKDSSTHNNIGGIGGYNIGGYYATSNNNYNYPIKNNNSGSIIEENIEGEGFIQNNKKENSIRKNNPHFGPNKYKNKTKNTIKEDIEGESGGSNNNSKEINKNNNINVNKSNKFNNYDYNEIYDVKNDDEIEENINYEASANKDDLSDKKKMEMASISGIVKVGDGFESVGGSGLLQLQSHAGGYGMNEKESFGDFEQSKGKTNVNNKKGNEIQSKFNQQQQLSQKPVSGDIPEEIDSDSGF